MRLCVFKLEIQKCLGDGAPTGICSFTTSTPLLAYKKGVTTIWRGPATAMTQGQIILDAYPVHY